MVFVKGTRFLSIFCILHIINILFIFHTFCTLHLLLEGTTKYYSTSDLQVEYAPPSFANGAKDLQFFQRKGTHRYIFYPILHLVILVYVLHINVQAH